MHCRHHHKSNFTFILRATEKLVERASGVDPVVEFFELIHIGDILLQTVDMYYQETIVRQSRFNLMKLHSVSI